MGWNLGTYFCSLAFSRFPLVPVFSPNDLECRHRLWLELIATLEFRDAPAVLGQQTFRLWRWQMLKDTIKQDLCVQKKDEQNNSSIHPPSALPPYLPSPLPFTTFTRIGIASQLCSSGPSSGRMRWLSGGNKLMGGEVPSPAPFEQLAAAASVLVVGGTKCCCCCWAVCRSGFG